MHRRRDVRRDHAGTERGDRERELAGPGAEIQHSRRFIEAEALKEPDLAVRIAILLGVVARDVDGVKVLSSSAGSLVE